MFVLEIQCVCHVDEWVNVSEWVAVGVVWGCLCYRASVFRHSYSVCGWVYLCCKCQHVYSWYVCVCVCVGIYVVSVVGVGRGGVGVWVHVE